MVTLQFSEDDVAFLSQQVHRQLEHLQNELVHTDDRELHRALAADVAKLEALGSKLAGATSTWKGPFA